MTSARMLKAVLSGNDYSGLERGLLNDPPKSPISMVVPTYNRADKLARSLAAATHLHTPPDGLEVVVADDGSTDATAEIVRTFESRLNITYVRRSDRGHRLAEICNAGIRTARNDRIVLLQSDMIPSPSLLTAYGRWLDLESPVLLVGMRHFTCTDNLSAEMILRDPSFEAKLPKISTANEMWRKGGELTTEDWRLPIYQRTDWLRTDCAPFRAVVGCNLAFRREDALRIGGFCEEFQSWGGEDGEFGYRAYLAGLAIIPVAGASAYHQEPPGGINETDRRKGFEASKCLREDKCALPPFRRASSLGPHSVPRVAVGQGSSGRAPLNDETLSLLQAQTFDDGPVGSPAAHRLAMLTATVAAPYLLICGGGWAEREWLPPETLDLIVARAADGILIEARAPGLLITARSWNRVAANLDSRQRDAGFDAFIKHLADLLVLKRFVVSRLQTYDFV